MKKILAIVLALVMMMTFVACNATDKPQAESATAETVSAISDSTDESKQLLDEILATDSTLGLMDDEYYHVVDYISREPDKTNGGVAEWNLGEEYSLSLNLATRRLTLIKGEYWKRTLCLNIDQPNLGYTTGVIVVDDYTFCEMLDSIEVWQLGNELFEIELPSSEIELVGTNRTDEYSETIIRSDSTVGSITLKDGEFKYKEIISDCARPIQMYQCSVWYINTNAELIHLNVLTKELEKVAENVTCLVPVHDNIHSLGWREKGSLEWHEPDFYVTYKGKITPWSEHGGK